MQIQSISGLLLRDMLITAANALESHKQEINELNVFPVPDGDTGTNMSMTMGAALKALSMLDGSCTVGKVADTAASSLLRGARGNSGVILSLLFRGIARAFSGKKTVGGRDLSQALAFGVEAAYKAVMRPAEGTILTVARRASEAADALLAQNPQIAFSEVFETVLNTARETLAQTPEMLPVLKKAGVVDSGGRGLVVIYEAMRRALNGDAETTANKEEEAPGFAAGAVGEADEEINFTYCTEFIINRGTDSKRDPLTLRAFLESIGDCVLVADDRDIIKVHCHTDNPGRAIQEALEFGYLTDIKIDNMREQHEKKAAALSLQYADQENEYGFVAVAAGKGLISLFGELGADNVVDGGQTMNPSTDDILAAVEATPAKTVFVLPNNKNIILSAEQAVSLADRAVFVLHTKDVAQGMSAMLAFDRDADMNTNVEAMEGAYGNIRTGQVTYAARDTEFDGFHIKKGEILGLASGKLVFTEKSVVSAASRLIIKLADKNTSYIAIIYGGNISQEQAETVKAMVSEKYGLQAEINVIDGGQPVYDFLVSVE